MALTTIDALLLQKMFLNGAKCIEANKEYINELNVFPVPDGDTGTNMTLTIMAAAKEVSQIENPQMGTLAKAISNGSLRGARGNSGVILSQLFRGFTKEIADCKKIDVTIMSNAFAKAVETAYKAVMKPKEGTILTVARGGAEKAAELALETDDMEYFCGEILKHMEEVLLHTPDLLPVLKEAGVVDSGGQGLLVILKGAYDTMLGKASEPVNVSDKTSLARNEADTGINNIKSNDTNMSQLNTSDIKFGYCTEFIILIEKEYNINKETEFKSYLESIGDSIVVVSDDGIVKVHVHTNDPGLAIQRALTYGQLSSIKIDNMREEHQEKVIKEAEKKEIEKSKTEEKTADKKISEENDDIKNNNILSNNIINNDAVNNELINNNEANNNTINNNAVNDDAIKTEIEKADTQRRAIGFIAISVGEGINKIFKGLGVDYLIEGGQTMNPSTEDILNAIDQVNADVIYVFPNNSNIILAAQQAQELTKANKQDKEIIVIPSKTIPQGITALINYVFDKSSEENERRMTDEMKKVKSGQVTYAVRDTNIDGKEIKQGDIMGLNDKTILSVGSDILLTSFKLLNMMISEEDELVSIYYGEETTEEEARMLAEYISDRHPSLDVEVHYGGQPIYYYIFSVE